MDEKYYFRLWTLFKGQTARRAIESGSTEDNEHYDRVLEDMALLEAEVILED